MNLVDCVRTDHKRLRDAYAEAAAFLAPPTGIGWEDRQTLDMRRFQRALYHLANALNEHIEFERRNLDRILCQLESAGHSASSIERGRALLGSALDLCRSVSFASDGEHLHPIRCTLARLGETLEEHLQHEEKKLLPQILTELSSSLLDELGRRAAAHPR